MVLRDMDCATLRDISGHSRRRLFRGFTCRVKLIGGRDSGVLLLLHNTAAV